MSWGTFSRAGVIGVATLALVVSMAFEAEAGRRGRRCHRRASCCPQPCVSNGCDTGCNTGCNTGCYTQQPSACCQQDGQRQYDNGRTYQNDMPPAPAPDEDVNAPEGSPSPSDADAPPAPSGDGGRPSAPASPET